MVSVNIICYAQINNQFWEQRHSKLGLHSGSDSHAGNFCGFFSIVLTAAITSTVEEALAQMLKESLEQYGITVCTDRYNQVILLHFRSRAWNGWSHYIITI